MIDLSDLGATREEESPARVDFADLGGQPIAVAPAARKERRINFADLGGESAPAPTETLPPPQFRPSPADNGSGQDFNLPRDLARGVGATFGGAGKIATAVVGDAARAMRGERPQDIPALVSTDAAIQPGIDLPIETAVKESALEEKQQSRFPKATVSARMALGLAKSAPKIATVMGTGGGSLLAEAGIAGGLFGLDDEGNFHPKEAIVGALLPGVGRVGRIAVGAAIGKTLASGGMAPMGATGQKVMETIGEQAAMDAYMTAADAPELIRLAKEDPSEFRARLAETIGSNLAFALFGAGRFAKDVPSATKDWVLKNADSLATKKVIESYSAGELRDIYSRVNAGQQASQAEKDLVSMINSQLGKPAEAIKKGVEIVEQGWPEKLAQMLGTEAPTRVARVPGEPVQPKPRGRSLRLLTEKGEEANAVNPILEPKSLPIESSGTVQVGQTPAATKPRDSLSRPAGQPPEAPVQPQAARPQPAVIPIGGDLAAQVAAMEAPAREFAKTSGFEFKPAGVAGTEGLPPDVAAKLPRTWEFTDRRPDSPTQFTFYVPAGSSAKAIEAAYERKKAEFAPPVAPDVETLSGQQTGTKPIVAVRLDDGRVLFSKRWSAHIDAASLPPEISNKVVDGGFVVSGKWERGGDLSQGLKPGEKIAGYYGKAEPVAPRKADDLVGLSESELDAMLDEASKAKPVESAKSAAPKPAALPGGPLIPVPRGPKPLEAERTQILRLLSEMDRRRERDEYPLPSREAEDNLKKRLAEIERSLMAEATVPKSPIKPRGSSLRPKAVPSDKIGQLENLGTKVVVKMAIGPNEPGTVVEVKQANKSQWTMDGISRYDVRLDSGKLLRHVHPNDLNVGTAKTPTKERTATDIAKEAAKAGIKGVDESIQGLHDLFGGGTHMGSGPNFDEQTYAKAKPHFKAAYDQFKKAGKSLKEFFEFIFKQFGERIRPYLKRFIQELQAEGKGAKLPADADERTESAGSGKRTGGTEPATTGATGGVGEAAGGDQGPGGKIQSGTGKTAAGDKGGRRGAGRRPDAAAGGLPGEQEPETVEPGAGEDSAANPAQLPGEPTEPDSKGLKPKVHQPKNLYLDSDPAPAGLVARITANVQALALVKDLEKEGRLPTDAERQVLAAWSGWGSFKELFNEGRAERREWDPNWTKRYGRTYDKLRTLLTPAEFNAAAESSVNAHYTSQEVIVHGMWAGAARLGFAGGRVLEPSAGKGSAIAFTPAELRSKIRWGAIELEPITGKILGYLYPEADVRVQGFEEAKIPNAFYDMAFTNVPFHEVGPGKEYPDLNLHNYFIARMLDKVKPGGLVVAITTKNTMEASADQRRFLATKGQLIGAIRLPNNAFKESAGTEVVTDILFLRKPDGKPFAEAQRWESTVSLGTPSGEMFELNEYFDRHPEMVLGKHALTGTMYRKNEYTVEGSGPLTPKLQAAIQKLPEGIFQRETEPSTFELSELEDFTLQVDSKGHVLEVRNFHLQAVTSWDSTKPELAKRARDYVKLRDLLMGQYALERNPEATDEQIETNRKKLRAGYQAWLKAHGTLNQNQRKTGFLSTDPGYYTVMGLENVKEEPDPDNAGNTLTVVSEADVLSKRMIQPDIPPAKSESATDALGVVMSYRGRLDMEYMRQLTGLTDEQIEADLIAANLAFKDPESGRLHISAEYLTGDVRDKLAKAIFAAKESPLFQRNVEALRAVIPPTVPFDRIQLDITARWTPLTVLNKFAETVIGLEPGAISIIPTVEEFSVKEQRYLGDKAKAEWSMKRMEAPELLQYALNFRRANIVDRDKDGKAVRDEDGTALANQIIDKMKAEYAQWIRSTDLSVPYRYFDDQRGDYREEQLPIWDAMEREFNKKANSFVVPDFDGSMLRLPGLSSAVRRTPHLMNGVMRAIAGGSAVFAHGVGSGKTFLAVVASNELRRIGLAKKMILVIKKPTVDQYRMSVQRAYPGSRLLIPAKKDFEPANRKKLISRIASTRWDFIVLTHEQFKAIKPGEQLLKDFYEDQLNQLRQILKDRGEVDAELAKSTRGMDNTTRSIVRKIKTLKKRMDQQLGAVGKHQDKGSNWENLGIDGIFVDESHNFKKMPIPTQMEGEVKGIPSDYSQRAVDLLVKVRDIQRVTNGRNVFFASGTPVSNTLAELWVQFYATNPKLLKDFGIETFDSFASTYADVLSNFELGWDNTFKNVTRMARFKNPSGLTTLTRLGMDVKIGNKELGLDVPDIEGGKPKIYTVKPTVAFDRWLGLLDDIVETWDSLDPKGRFLNSWIPIATMRAGVAAALDPRCVFAGAEDDPGSKVNLMIAHAFEEWRRGRELRTTMMIFADMYRTLNTEKLLSAIGGETGGRAGVPAEVEIPEAAVPTIEDVSEAEGEIADSGAKAEAEFEKHAVGSFNLYHDIRTKLVARGVPEHEIGIITEHDTDAKRDSLFNKVRNGVVRILIGSTEKIGEGVDVPQRMSAQFHLDPPMQMTPAKMEQRIGRIIRQGNMFSVKNLNQPVRINIYAMEKSMDAAIYQMLETKGTMVIQALKGQFLGDTFDDPASELTMAMAEIKAAATGDTRVLDMAKLQKQVRDLSTEQGAYYRRVSELRRLGEEEQRSARYAHESASNNRRLHDVAAPLSDQDETLTMLHVRSQTRVTGREAIKEWLKKARTAIDEAIKADKSASSMSLIFGDNLRVYFEAEHRVYGSGEQIEHVMRHSAVFYLGGPEARYNDPRYDSNLTSIEGVLSVLDNIPGKAETRADEEEIRAAEHEKRAVAYQQQLAQTKFEKADELQAKSGALRALESELRTERSERIEANKKKNPPQEGEKGKQGSLPTGSELPAAESRQAFKTHSLDMLRAELPHVGLPEEAQRLLAAFLDLPLAKMLPEIQVRISDALDGGWQGSYWQRVAEIARNASPETGPHELLHAAWEILPADIKEELERMRAAALDSMVREAKEVGNDTFALVLEDVKANPTRDTDEFVGRNYQVRSLRYAEAYPFSSAEEFFAHSASNRFKQRVGSIQEGFWARVKQFIKDFIEALKRALRLKPKQADVLDRVLDGDFEPGRAQSSRNQASFSNPAAMRRAKAVADYGKAYDAERAKNTAEVEHTPASEDGDELWNVYSKSKGNENQAIVYPRKDGTGFDVRNENDMYLDRQEKLEDALDSAKTHVESGGTRDLSSIEAAARQEIINAIDIPAGMELKDVQDTKWGSVYYLVRKVLSRDEDGEPDDYQDYKISIRNHDPSPFREKEFGASNAWFEVSKNPSPQELADAVTKVERYLASKADASGRQGSIRTREEAIAEAEREGMLPHKVYGEGYGVLDREQINDATIAASKVFAKNILTEAGLPAEEATVADADTGRLKRGWLMAPQGRDMTAEGRKLIELFNREISKQSPGKASQELAALVASITINFGTNVESAVNEMKPGVRMELFRIARSDASARGIALAALQGWAKDIKFVGRNLDVELGGIWNSAFDGDELSRVIDDLKGQLSAGEATIEDLQAQLDKALRKKGRKGLRKMVGRNTVLSRKIVEIIKAGGDAWDVLKELAIKNGWKVPTDADLTKIKAWVEEWESLERLSPDEQARAGTAKAARDAALREKLAVTEKRRADLRKQVETAWSRFTKPMTLRTATGRANVTQAIGEFVSANLLLKVGFATRQTIDVLTQGALYTPTRAIEHALGIHQKEVEAGRRNRADVWQVVADTSNALKQAYYQRTKALGGTLMSVGEVLRGHDQGKHVARLMGRVSIFDRAMQKADEAEARGDRGQAFLLRLFTVMRLGYRVAQAMDQLHGNPAVYQEMRQQVVAALRENGMTRAESETKADWVMGDIKAEMAIAVPQAELTLQANGVQADQREIKAAAYRLVQAKQYERMRALALPADDFADRNLELLDTLGWNEAESGGVGGVIAGVMRGGGRLAAQMSAASPVLMPLSIPLLTMTRFGNAIGILINRKLSFTPLGFFPGAFGVNEAEIDSETGIATRGSPWYRTEEDRRQRKVEASVGTAFQIALFSLVVAGVIRVLLKWPKDKEERQLWDKMGWRPGQVHIPTGSGEHITLSMNTGPMVVLSPGLSAGGALHDLMEDRAKRQKKLDDEAAKLGLEPGKILPISTADLMGVAGSAAWGSIISGRTLSGLLGSVSEFGAFQPVKTAASTISAVSPGLPGLQELDRLAFGTVLDSKIASVWDFLMPLPTSGAAQTNLLGDPVGEANGLQRVVSILTGGNYPLPVNDKDRQAEAAYRVLFESGYRPPSIDPNKAYSIDGKLRPLTGAELAKYTEMRGKSFKEGLSGVDPSDKAGAKAAYQAANQEALQALGVETPARQNARSGHSNAGTGQMVQNAGGYSAKSRPSLGSGLPGAGRTAKPSLRGGLRRVTGPKRPSMASRGKRGPSVRLAGMRSAVGLGVRQMVGFRRK